MRGVPVDRWSCRLVHVTVGLAAVLAVSAVLAVPGAFAQQAGYPGGQLIMPQDGSTLSASFATFMWTAGSDMNEYWLDLGSQPGGADLHSENTGSRRALTVSGLPSDGSTIYIRLWSRFTTGWIYTDAAVTAHLGDDVYTGPDPDYPGAQMLAPTPGTELDGTTAIFAWTAGSAMDEYWLEIGSEQGGTDLFDHHVGSNTRVTVGGLPSDGSPVFVRLWSRLVVGWIYQQYTYTGHLEPPEEPCTTWTYDLHNHPFTVAGHHDGYGLRLTELLDVTRGQDQFVFDFDHPDSQMHLELGPDHIRIHGRAHGGPNTRPRPGSGLNADSGLWSIDFMYDTGVGPASNDDDIVVSAHNHANSGMIQPLFDDDAGPVELFDRRVQAYSFRFGDGGDDLGMRGHDGLSGLGGLDRAELRLGSNQDGWMFTAGNARCADEDEPGNDEDPGDDPGAPAPLDPAYPGAQLQSPWPGTELPGTQVTFTWTSGSDLNQYWLALGSTPGGNDLFDHHMGSQTRFTLYDLPADGRALYMRLSSRFAGTGWIHKEYQFRAPGSGARPAPAVDPGYAGGQLITPQPASELPAGAVVFEWTAGSGLQHYWLELGSTPGATDLLDQDTGPQRQVTVSGLPTDGRVIFVRVWSRFTTGWIYKEYQLRAHGS